MFGSIALVVSLVGEEFEEVSCVVFQQGLAADMFGSIWIIVRLVGEEFERFPVWFFSKA